MCEGGGDTLPTPSFVEWDVINRPLWLFQGCQGRVGSKRGEGSGGQQDEVKEEGIIFDLFMEYEWVVSSEDGP